MLCSNSSHPTFGTVTGSAAPSTPCSQPESFSTYEELHVKPTTAWPSYTSSRRQLWNFGREVVAIGRLLLYKVLIRHSFAITITSSAQAYIRFSTGNNYLRIWSLWRWQITKVGRNHDGQFHHRDVGNVICCLDSTADIGGVTKSHLSSDSMVGSVCFARSLAVVSQLSNASTGTSSAPWNLLHHRRSISSGLLAKVVLVNQVQRLEVDGGLFASNYWRFLGFLRAAAALTLMSTLVNDPEGFDKNS